MERTGRVGAMVAAAAAMGWSPEASACGMGAAGAGAVVALAYGLLIVFLLSLIAVLSLRPAGRALSRMRAQRPGRGLAFAHGLTRLMYGLAIAATIVSGGMLFAGLLIMM